MRLYIIRHADPDYIYDTITPTGHKEATALADYLETLGMDELYSSPMGRARDTAQYSADRLHLPVQVEAWTEELRELWIPEMERMCWNLDGDVLRSPEALENHDHWQKLRPRIERYMLGIEQGSDDFLQRQGFVRQVGCSPAIAGCYQTVHSNRKKIAIFCHLGFGLAWLSHLLGIPLRLMWASFYIHPTSVTTVLFEERRSDMDGNFYVTPRCLGMGDISHLAKAGLTPTPAGIVANYF